MTTRSCVSSQGATIDSRGIMRHGKQQQTLTGDTQTADPRADRAIRSHPPHPLAHTYGSHTSWYRLQPAAPLASSKIRKSPQTGSRSPLPHGRSQVSPTRRIPHPSPSLWDQHLPHTNGHQDTNTVAAARSVPPPCFDRPGHHAVEESHPSRFPSRAFGGGIASLRRSIPPSESWRPWLWMCCWGGSLSSQPSSVNT